MERAFKVGDVVCAKAGGPNMTVSSVYSNESVMTIWFNHKDKLLSGNFPSDALDLAPEN